MHAGSCPTARSSLARSSHSSCSLAHGDLAQPSARAYLLGLLLLVAHPSARAGRLCSCSQRATFARPDTAWLPIARGLHVWPSIAGFCVSYARLDIASAICIWAVAASTTCC
jgi:hypothetical protein